MYIFRLLIKHVYKTSLILLTCSIHDSIFWSLSIDIYTVPKYLRDLPALSNKKYSSQNLIIMWSYLLHLHYTWYFLKELIRCLQTNSLIQNYMNTRSNRFSSLDTVLKLSETLADRTNYIQSIWYIVQAERGISHSSIYAILERRSIRAIKNGCSIHICLVGILFCIEHLFLPIDIWAHSKRCLYR